MQYVCISNLFALVTDNGLGQLAVPIETQKCDYERQRELQIEANRRRFEELGLHKFTSTVKSHESASSAGIRAGKGGRRAEDDSEYLPEAEEQVQGDTEDDSSLDDDPVPLMIIEVPRDGIHSGIL